MEALEKAIPIISLDDNDNGKVNKEEFELLEK
jgi:hypothetical protein